MLPVRLILYTLLAVVPSPLWAQGPKISSPTAARDPFKVLSYPWKKDITATIFWIGEKPTPKNPTPNHASSWDTKWQINFGGFDDPSPAARLWFVATVIDPVVVG